MPETLDFKQKLLHSGMVYPVYLPSVYMMSPHVTKFSQAFPHSIQRMEVGMAWE